MIEVFYEECHRLKRALHYLIEVDLLKPTSVSCNNKKIIFNKSKIDFDQLKV